MGAEREHLARLDEHRTQEVCKVGAALAVQLTEEACPAHLRAPSLRESAGLGLRYRAFGRAGEREGGREGDQDGYGGGCR